MVSWEGPPAQARVSAHQSGATHATRYLDGVENEQMTKKKETKKFPYVESLDELKQYTGEHGGFLSPEGAAKMLMITRSQVATLETKGEISGYRLKGGNSPEAKDHVFISLESVKAYSVRKKAADAAKAEAAKQPVAAAAAE